MQGNAATSLFDVNQFLETSHAGKLDTRYVLPDMGDYPAQTTDKITSRSGVIADGDYAGNAWAQRRVAMGVAVRRSPQEAQHGARLRPAELSCSTSTRTPGRRTK
jgi:hypothetical protein